ncbi:MAG: IS481 family transposase [Actinomycetota bacterium]|nr:IS481 family transposase [Actinomycetota bacterium]
MTKDDFILGHRLSLLSRAKSINNISRACREAGVSRTYYYKWAKRFTTYGIVGLREREKSKPKMPNTTRSEIVDKILAFIKEYPTYGPARIANELDSIVCPATVYNILKKRGLNRKIDRLLALEDIPVSVSLSPVMARKIDEAGPLPRIESHYSGYMLSVDTFYVCRLKGVGRIYQFSAIDTFSSFGFAYLYTDKSAKSAIDFIDKTVEIFAQIGITVERVLTDHGKEYTTHWEGGYHLFEKYLRSKDIKHRYTKVRHPWTNGFVERFQRTILEEFYQPSMLKKTYHSLEELQDDLGQFLYFYNFQRTHQGYRTKGSKPCDLLYKCGDFLSLSP